MWCSVRVAPALCRGLGELPNKRKGINFCQPPHKGWRAKGYPFPLLAKSFVICSRVPHLATFQKDSAFQKSTFLFRFVRDDTLNMNTYYDSLVLMIQHILTKHNIRVVTMKRRLPNFCIIESYDFDSMVPEHPARPDNCFPIGTLRPK